MYILTGIIFILLFILWYSGKTMGDVLENHTKRIEELEKKIP